MVKLHTKKMDAMINETHKVFPDGDGPDMVALRATFVQAFHKRLGVSRVGFDNVDARRLRARLVMEEVVEYMTGLLGSQEARALLIEFAPPPGANEQPSIVEWMDGRCDIEFLLHGDDDVFGWDSSEYFAEVARTNLEKAGGPRDEHGKIRKPAGWQPPDIAGMMAAGVGKLR